MKLKMVAAAVAVLASNVVFAQSSVTLYGVADIGVEYVSHASTGKSVSDAGSAVRMQSGNMSTSRWGLRGVEDLGGGLKGVFALESGFALDTGAANTRLFDRQAYVGVQSNYGAVTLGRHQTPVYDFAVAYDPMAMAPRYSLYSMDADMASRADNSIKYVGVFGGLTASALYSFGYDMQGANGAGVGEKPGNARQGREYSLGLNYATGPFGIGAVYDMRQALVTDGVDLKVQRASVAGSYAYGPAKAFLGYRWAKVTQPGAGNRSNLWWGGLGYQATPALSLTGAVYYQGYRGTKTDPWLFVASGDYALSKRTDLYMNLAYSVNRTDGNIGSQSTLGVAGTDTTIAGYPAPFAAGTAGKQNQFGAVVGVRHKF